MASEEEARAALRWQADFCRGNESPLTGLICDAVATVLDHETETGRQVLTWQGNPAQDALPLRIAGGLHALHRGGWAPELGPIYRGTVTAADEVAARVAAAIVEHDAQMLPWLDGPPQTNEPGRSAVLMAGLLAVAATYPAITGLELLEIGSSAGLNLMIGRYGYDLGGVAVGAADAAIRLAPEWRGPPPPDAPRWIESVRGVDIAPIDLSEADQAERLLAYIWADQGERLERTARAIAMAQDRPPRLDRGDGAVWLKERLKEPQAEGRARVLMHSVVWPYLPKKTKLTIEALMAAARGRASETKPLVWLAYEWAPDRGMHQLSLRSWPGLGLDRVLAYAQPHGGWIEWLSSSPRGR